jgi:hypothetical protein
MKNIYKITLIVLAFLSVNMKAQWGCFTPSLGIFDANTFAPMSATVPCTYTNIINISPTQFSSGNSGNSPCMRIILGVTNSNAATNNSIAIGEGTVNPAIDLCSSGCYTFIPSSSTYTFSLSGLDPTQNHGYNLCNVNVAPNMTYTIASCYSNVPLASGVWNNSLAGGCQTVNIPANSPIGTSGYSISPSLPSTASLSTGTGDLYLDTYQMAQGVYTVTYFFNSQASCSVTATRTISITNPYTASWTALSALCANGNCVNLVPQITGTGGGTFTAVSSAVTSNSFCPATSGAGTFPVTYTVGISPQCGATASNNIVVNATPVANAGPTKSLTCLSSTVSLSGSGGGTYSWSGPGIISGGTTSSPVVGSVGNYSLTVTSSGCSSTPAVVSVVNNTTPPSATAGSTGSITCVNATINLTSGPGAMTYAWTAPAGSSITGGINVQNTTGSGPGVYTVTVMNPVNGCTAMATAAATTNTVAPSASAGVTGTITCVNNSVNLTSTPGSMTYTWTAPAGSSISGGTNVQNTTGSGPGTYTVTVMDPNNGCVSFATVSAPSNTIAPTVGAVTSNSVICVGQTATLTASGASTYSWSTSASGSVIAVSPTITASYTVTGTDVNGCTNIATITQTVSACTGIHELSSNNGIIIFPNPAKEQITISYSSPIKTIKIVGVDGKLVMQRTNIDNSLSQTINISELRSGIYFVNCMIDGRENYFKIVKE